MSKPATEQPDNFAGAEFPDPDSPAKAAAPKPPKSSRPAAKPAAAPEPTPAPVVAAQPAAVDEGPQLPPTPAEEAVSSNASLPPTNQTSANDGRNVCLLMAQYKQTNPLTLTSCAALRDPARVSMVIHHGDAFIVHTRNRLAQTFLDQTSAEWALFVDDDMVLPFGNADWFMWVTGFNLPPKLRGLNTIDRLIAARKTLVGGLYFGRQHLAKPRAMFAEGGRGGQYEARNFSDLPADKVVPTRWVGTGCLLVHRSVFIAIQKRFPHLAPPKKGDPWQFFSAAPDPLIEAAQRYLAGTGSKEQLAASLRAAQTYNLGTGEDVLFCERATTAGHQPHVDLGLLCGHVGNTVFGPPTR